LTLFSILAILAAKLKLILCQPNGL